MEKFLRSTLTLVWILALGALLPACSNSMLLEVTQGFCSTGTSDPCENGPADTDGPVPGPPYSLEDRASQAPGASYLGVINRSSEPGELNVIFYQRNPAAFEPPTAWIVAANLGQNDEFIFDFPFDVEVSAETGLDDETDPIPAEPGDAFTAVLNSSRALELQETGHDPVLQEIQILNQVPGTPLQANVYRNDRLLFTKEGLAPGAEAVFRIDRQLFVTVLPGIKEGEPVDPLTTQTTSFDLSGVISAVILVTGSSTSGFAFSLGDVISQ